MKLLQQLEQITGQRIPVCYPETLAAWSGAPAKEAMQALERNSRLVNIRELVAGKVTPTGPLLILIRDCREGFLVQLYEGLRVS